MIVNFNIPELDKSYLQSKLDLIRYPNEFEDASVGWTCGTPTWAVKEMLQAWQTNYNWEKTLKEINRWQHFKVNIHDLNIHFIHEKSSNPSSIPIILIHGWPSTFYEFHKMIEPLKDKAFHVVVPSLPGFGFSDPPKHPGDGNITQQSKIMHQLMLELGYDKYMIYGTDWGATIGTVMTQNYPKHILGFITNMPSIHPPLPTFSNLLNHPIKVLKFLLSIIVGLTLIYGQETASLEKMAYANVDKCESAAYRAIQSARPYSIAYGLTDSPIGLLGWLLEFYHDWTYHETEQTILPNTITINEFLTQVTIYWITNTISSSSRIYYEFSKEMNSMKRIYLQVPLAVSYFKKEAFMLPRDWLEASAKNLVQFKVHSKGGHFPALEEPEILLNDIYEFRSIIDKSSFIKQKDD